MNNKKLLLKLFGAQDELEVESIISSHPILSKDKNWKPYGGSMVNFNQIHNQQQLEYIIIECTEKLCCIMPVKGPA